MKYHSYNTQFLKGRRNYKSLSPYYQDASHATPWKEATDKECLDPSNGFPLAVHLDSLIDAGLISFTDTGTILLSPHLTSETQSILNITPTLTLRPQPIPPITSLYLAYHREHVFKGK